MSLSERRFVSSQIFPGGCFPDLDSEVNHRDINGKSVQSEASELALDGRNHVTSIMARLTSGAHEDGPNKFLPLWCCV